MTRRVIPTEARPGQGEHARVKNPTSGREWYGEVLKWALSCPQIRDAGTAEVRWFPASWVVEVYDPEDER